MKCIVFDSGPIISLALNSLLNIMPRLKDRFKGDFYITSAVEEELIEYPSKSKKFALEALQIKKMLKDRSLEIFDTTSFETETDIITKLANSIFSIKGRSLKILNRGELESLVLAKNINAMAVVVDERTTRLLLENPYRLHKYLEKKFNSMINVDKNRLKEFESHFSTLKIIRSVELALVSIDLGFFDDYISLSDKQSVVSAVLWALKYKGCAISEIEIKKLIKFYKKSVN
jgi:predicted nucleic acid-binding protein